MQKDYLKQKLHRHWMDTDHRASKFDRRKYAKSARLSVKKDIEKFFKNLEDDKELMILELLNEEANEAWYCHTYGPCDICLERLRKSGT